MLLPSLLILSPLDLNHGNAIILCQISTIITPFPLILSGLPRKFCLWWHHGLVEGVRGGWLWWSEKITLDSDNSLANCLGTLKRER